ncbi:MAG: mechanosensitive ion channel family protein [Cyanobacteria bacterium J06632_19]
MLESNLLIWLFILGLGFPILNVVLHEAAERLARKQHPLGIALRRLRQYVLPPLALLLVIRILFRIASTEPSTRILETITWVAVVVAAIPLLNAFLTTKKTSTPGQIQVPNLLFQTIRAAVILLILYRVLGGIWQVDLSGLAAALGVGSLVVALALQDTLSNLVSGLLLLIASPFKEGDWIEVDGTQGRVIDQNWWSVTLEHNRWEEKITIPNGTLSKATIKNFGQDGIWHPINVSFSYDDAPDRVLSALESISVGFENDIGYGNVFPLIESFGDKGIDYSVWYKNTADWGNFRLVNQFMTRIYYLAKRNNFTIPYPIAVQLNYELEDGLPKEIPCAEDNRLQEMADFLRSLSYLSSLEDAKINELATKAKFETYGSGEYITQQGIDDEGLYFVYTGKIRISIKTRQGHTRELNSLTRGSVFGELSIFPGEVSPITALSEQDAEVVMILDEEMMQLIESNPQFSLEFSQFIEQRKRAMESLQDIASKSHQTVASNGKIR